METYSLVTWLFTCLVGLPLTFVVVSGLYRAKMRKRRLIAEYLQVRARRQAAWGRAGA